MRIIEDIRKMCTPAIVYLTISVVGIIVLLLQNLGNRNKYCVGNYSCDVPNTVLMFVLKVLGVAVWTYILNAICRAGYVSVSWFLVLLPFILFFVGIGLMIVLQSRMKSQVRRGRN